LIHDDRVALCNLAFALLINLLPVNCLFKAM
jgi:hypothetical protein